MLAGASKPIAFPLSAPPPAAYTIIQKYGPVSATSFNEGVTLGIPNPTATRIRAVCPGFITYHQGTSGTLRIEPTIRISANGYESVSAFIISGVESLLPSMLDAQYNRWVSGMGGVDWSTIVGGDPGRDGFEAAIQTGDVSIEVRNLDADIGMELAVPRSEVSISIETTVRKGATSPLFNTVDPPSFWRQALDDGVVTPSDSAFLGTFVQSNFANQVVLELREESNGPLDAHYPESENIRVSGAAVTELQGNQIAFGVTVFAATGSPIGVRAVDKVSGQLLTSVDDQFLFWDSVTKTSQAQQTTISVPATPVHIVIQALRPANWFAPQAASFGATFPNSGRVPLQRYSRGNNVTPLVDGQNYFSNLAAAVRALTPTSPPTDEYWHLAGWSMDKETSLDLVTSGNSSAVLKLDDLLTDYAQKTVLLLWSNVLSDYQPATAAAGAVLPSTRVLMDTRNDFLTFGSHNYNTAAIHMKVATVRRGPELFGYCGGIDLWPDRVTDSTHENSVTESQFGQHDVQLLVSGPAAYDLDLVLYQRWADQRPNDATFPPPASSLSAVSAGTQVVQVARTAPAIGLSFASNGDHTIRDTLLRAIGRAKQYIYIEDQYFSNPDIVQAIRSSLAGGLAFFVLVMPRFYLDWEFDPQTLSIVVERNERPWVSAQQLLDDFPDRVRICYLQNLQDNLVYVHSKTQIIDDVFVSSGSANMDIRGVGDITQDFANQECNLMSIDENVTSTGSRQFAQNLRIRLWSEHFGLDPADPTLVDPLFAYARYWKPGEPGRQYGHVRFFPDP